MEYRLTWKKRHASAMSSDHSRRVATEQEGFDLIADLGDDGYDAEVVGGARTCSCRMKKPDSLPAAELPQTDSVGARGEYSRAPIRPIREAEPDRKTIASGDRE